MFCFRCPVIKKRDSYRTSNVAECAHVTRRVPRTRVPLYSAEVFSFLIHLDNRERLFREMAGTDFLRTFEAINRRDTRGTYFTSYIRVYTFDVRTNSIQFNFLILRMVFAFVLENFKNGKSVAVMWGIFL